MKYQAIYLPKAEKFFKKQPKNISQLIFQKIQSVVENPHGFRLRIGDFRVIYILDEETKRLIVTKIDHRSSVYLN